MLQGETNPDPITEYTPCQNYKVDLFDGYDPAWTKTTLIEFIQGKWILDTVTSNKPDPVPDPDSAYVPPDFYIEFRDTIAIIYDLSGNFLAKAPLSLVLSQYIQGLYQSTPDVQGTDFDPWYGYLRRLVIPCNDQLVFANSHLDGSDYYFRPYEE